MKQSAQTPKIKVIPNGPYIVTGSVPLRRETVIADSDGTPVRWEQGEEFPLHETYSLCRCGRSKNTPYCDGSHTAAGFAGTETASHTPYLKQAEKITGPGVDMTDARALCSQAMFCHRATDAWNLTEHSDDPAARETAIQEMCNCPSGALVAWDKETGQPIEPRCEPSITVVEEPYRDLSGPLRVKGGIPIESANGTLYEPRNRVTLCRCGKSQNTPFCDGSHVTSKFIDTNGMQNEQEQAKLNNE